MVVMMSNETVEEKGIKLYKFFIPVAAMQNSTAYPPNEPYFQYGETGVTNITSCTGGNLNTVFFFFQSSLTRFLFLVLQVHRFSSASHTFCMDPGIKRE
jgi:hypothetical protein